MRSYIATIFVLSLLVIAGSADRAGPDASAGSAARRARRAGAIGSSGLGRRQ